MSETANRDVLRKSIPYKKSQPQKPLTELSSIISNTLSAQNI